MQALNFEMARAELEKRVVEVDKLDLENDKIRAETAETWAKVKELMEGEGVRTVQELAAAEKAVAEVENTIADGRRADAQEKQQASQQTPSAGV